MQIEILSRTAQAGIDNRAVVRDRVSSLLDRFEPRIRALDVQLVDLNGPKGGVDRHCRVRAALRDGSLVISEARATLIPAAIDRAVRRLARLIDAERKRVVCARRQGGGLPEIG